MSPALARGSASDTIFAPATGMGRSAIAVIRISGGQAGDMLAALCGALPPPRTASLRTLRDQAGGIIDHAIVVWFPAPASYTGEACAELHIHGGRAVLTAVTQALLQAGGRPADPGEFTRRAVANGKMDLLAAEAVADLIDSETEWQRAGALRQLSGAQSAILADWSARLTRCLAWQETLIDFTDADLPIDMDDTLSADLARMEQEIGAQLGAAETGERLRRGLVFAIVGAPNVGKSSLLNALAGRAAAIVSPHPGTTRDAVRVELVLGGVPVTLVDTAGLRETDDPIESEGIRRAREEAETADFVLAVIDADGNVSQGPRGLVVANKVDLAAPRHGALGVSALTGQGLSALRDRLTDVALKLAGAGASPTFNRARHAAALRDAVAFLIAARAARQPELRAEEIRAALDALGRISGKVTTEAVLDVVFAAFCIGK